MRVEPDAKCDHGCLWLDHDDEGRCRRDCLWCPIGACAGHKTRVNRYRPQIQLL